MGKLKAKGQLYLYSASSEGTWRVIGPAKRVLSKEKSMMDLGSRGQYLVGDNRSMKVIEIDSMSVL